ncbi:hypothetical protein IU486_16410 [Streptomyces gardneri]|nr:hypothetical protein [Streptomyces gardneri]
MPKELGPIALRLARVDLLAQELGELAAAWSLNSPVGMKQIAQESGELAAVVIGVRPIPPLASMLFSEAIHHLRAAMENVPFYLVEEERGSAIPEKDSPRIKVPVQDDATKFSSWQDSVKKHIPELVAGTTLGDRLMKLQPYIDTASRVPSISELLGRMMGVNVDYEHPMLLLQRYPNIDKHRVIRMAAARTIFKRGDAPMVNVSLEFQNLEPGTVLTTTRPGEPVMLELNSAVMVERPDSPTMVGPMVELSYLHRHVAEVVIPTLVTGRSLPQSLPPAIDLGNSGKTVHERIQAGEWSYAHNRWSSAAFANFDEWSSIPPEILETAQPNTGAEE